MVYSNNFAVALLAQPRRDVVREFQENGSNFAYLPFGTEYALRLKNINSKTAVVSVEIDGEDVLSNNQLIVLPNDYVDLEGFMENMQITHRFKFIEKTDKIANFRGNKIEDGLIRVSWRFEKPSENVRIKADDPWRNPYNPWVNPNIHWNTNVHPGEKIKASVNFSTQTPDNCAIDSTQIETQNILRSFNDEGITVKGENIDQGVHRSYVGDLESQEHVIVLKLKGKKEDSTKVESPIYVRIKTRCPTCGTKTKSSYKFCPNCGTNILGKYLQNG
jgi:hypothetical protein